MKISELPDNLPKTAEKVEAAFRDCEKVERHVQKSRTFVDVPKEFYTGYIDSALKALNASRILLENGSYEWAIVPAYSAVYQAGNAVLVKELGKECRDHFCLLVTLMKLKKIVPRDVGKLTEIEKRLDKLPDESISFASRLRLARSSVIYKPSKDYDEKTIAEDAFKTAQEFVNTITAEVL